MARDTGEPQSHDQRRESDTSEADQGGRLSQFQLADGAEPSDYVSDPYTPVQKVTTRDGGAKRDSFFRKRDYE